VRILIGTSALAKGYGRKLTCLTYLVNIGPVPFRLPQAIADATDFDERDVNRNFDYDSAA